MNIATTTPQMLGGRISRSAGRDNSYLSIPILLANIRRKNDDIELPDVPLWTAARAARPSLLVGKHRFGLCVGCRGGVAAGVAGAEALVWCWVISRADHAIFDLEGVNRYTGVVEEVQ